MSETPALTQLWEQVRDWSHPDHPFLDPKYSPDSLMPACDFTLWIRDRLLEGDAESVRGLLAYVSPTSTAWWSVVDSFLTWRVPGYGGELEAELRAAMLLCYRMGFTKEMRHLRHDWPRMWSVMLAEGAERFVSIPPTTRLALAEFRAIPKDGKFNLSLFYGDRCYGNNAEWNQHYLAALGIESTVSDWNAACEDVLPKCRVLAIQSALAFYQHDCHEEFGEQRLLSANFEEQQEAEEAIVAIVEKHWTSAHERSRRERQRDNEIRNKQEDVRLALMTPEEKAAKLVKFIALKKKFDEIDKSR
jgi:hypothetical protein